MEIGKIIINNNKSSNNDLSNISNIWFYVVCLMKTALDTDKKLKNTICNRSELLYERFNDLKEKWEKVHQELENLLKANSVDENKLRELQSKQDLYSRDESMVQSKMSTFWRINMGSISNGELYATQEGYKFINDYYNNPAIRRK